MMCGRFGAMLVGLALLVVSCGRGASDRSRELSRVKDQNSRLTIVIGSQQRPTLKPPGPGAGQWGSEKPTMENRMLAKVAPVYLQSPSSIQQYGVEASGTFNHYFDNDGIDFKVDASKLLQAVPRIQTLYGACKQAVFDKLKELPPGDYDFTTEQAPTDVVRREEDKNWYLAVNGFSYYVMGHAQIAQNGQVSVRGFWYLWDFYDWDPGVKVPIDTPMGTIKVDQDRIGQLHRQGLAKEFAAVGQVSLTDPNDLL